MKWGSLTSRMSILFCLSEELNFTLVLGKAVDVPLRYPKEFSHCLFCL